MKLLDQLWYFLDDLDCHAYDEDCPFCNPEAFGE